MAKKGGWWFYGCLGCGGALLLLLLLVGGVGSAAWMRARSAAPENRVLEPELPAPPPAPAAEAPPGPTDAPLSGAATTILPAAAGRVVLDLSGAEFEVHPAAPGEPLRVEANYDPGSHLLEEKLEVGEGSGWVYRVTFQGKGSGLMESLGRLLGAPAPGLKIYLPPDMPLAMEARVRRGGLSADLGGLWLTDADVDVAQGGLALSVGEPLREPMEQLRVRASMGGVALVKMGNASPRRLDVELAMGGLALDLRGTWQRDADLHVHVEMGRGSLQLPRTAIVRGLHGEPRVPEGGPEVDLPVLTFDSPEIGDIEIHE